MTSHNFTPCLRFYETVIVLELTGEVETRSVVSFKTSLAHAQNSRGERRLLVDLRAVTWMDNAGWAILINAATSLDKRYEKAGFVVVMSPKSHVSRKSDILRLDVIIDRAESISDLGIESNLVS